MLSRERYERLLEAFPFLAAAPPALATAMRSTLLRLSLPTGRHVFQAGDCAAGLPLLLSGCVRVYLTGRAGREITLYRFGAGDACLLSANAVLSDQPLPAAAIVEDRADAVLVPAGALRAWVAEHAAWREFVFALTGRRLADVLAVVDAVVFRRMDTRVAALLVARARSRRAVRITHQEIASELGTSREVVSRILESLAGAGLLRAGRGRIEIVAEEALAELAAA